jgi:hypothetical protein
VQKNFLVVVEPKADGSVCPVVVHGRENAHDILDNMGSLNGTLRMGKV